MNFLSQSFGGLPLWGWLGIIGVGAAAAFYLVPKFFGGSSSATSATPSATGTTTSQPADPNIDPNTGVPYAVEEAINPATGLPAYFSLFGTQATGGITTNPPASGPQGPTVPVTPSWGPNGPPRFPAGVGGQGGGGLSPALPTALARYPITAQQPGQSTTDWEKINLFNMTQRQRMVEAGR